jgi:tetratricopeptide (TPR) repeat protein
MVETTASLTARELIGQVLAICGVGPEEHERVHSMFDALTTAALSWLADRPGTDRVEALVEFMKQEGFQPNSALPSVDLVRLMASRAGNCVEHTLLILLCGRALGIPMRPVRVPGHMFVRVRSDGVSRNVEPMNLGTFPRDDEYAAGLGVTPRQQERGLHLRDLSDSEFLAEVTHKVNYPLLSTGERTVTWRRHFLRQALRAHPDGTDLLNSLGIYCLRRGRVSFAERWLRKALEVDPDCTPALNNLVQTLVSQGRYREGIRIAEQSEDADLFANYLLLRNLGRAYLRVGQYSSAVRVYDELIRIFDTMQWPVEKQLIHPYLSCLYYCLGDYPASATAALTWAAISPSNQIGIVWAASAYHRAGADAEAMQLLDATNFVDPYVADLAAMMCGVLDGQDLVGRHPERVAEVESYLGEYWISSDPRRALGHWENCLVACDRQTFAHLRAERNLIDHSASAFPATPR